MKTAVVEGGHRLRGLCAARENTRAGHPGRRSSSALVSAISNPSLVRFLFIDIAMNADSPVEFVGQLIADSSQKVFLILDNLKVHHAKAVTRWVGEHPEQIELFHLPPYTPERNPTQYLNRDLKTQLRLPKRSSTPTPCGKKRTLSSSSSPTPQNGSWPVSITPSSSTPLDRTYLVAGSLTYNELNIVGDQTALTEGSTSLELSKTAS